MSMEGEREVTGKDLLHGRVVRKRGNLFVPARQRVLHLAVEFSVTAARFVYYFLIEGSQGPRYMGPAMRPVRCHVPIPMEGGQ